jgi:UDP-N-acetylglucosamine/UDP-N-acetylgalactosamine diphosphorylase
LSDTELVLQELRAIVAPYGQEHLLDFWGEMSAAEKASLAEQIRGVDFARLAELCRGELKGDDWADLARRASAPPAFRLGDEGAEFSIAQARRRGEEELAAGQLGVVLVAGGQGTRLGFDHPKGMFQIGPVSGAPLFQILFEKLRAVRRRYGVRIPLYLMTSPATHDETREFLDANDRFGLLAEDLHLFCQGTMPAVDSASGKVLLATRHELFLSPDGHGGMLAALAKSGCLADIRRRGLQQLFYFQVDNPLAIVCDPVFIGYHLLSDSELSTQVVAKQRPEDRVGNVVQVDGQVRIIEYSDLPQDAAERRDADGALELWAGNIAVHVLDVAFVERLSDADHGLPFHRARKKVPHIDPSGQLIEPVEPNAIKFEQFIFDLLPAAGRAIVVEVDETHAFAPVKNKSGDPRDTPETVQAQIIALHTQWLQEAGAIVSPGVAVEISPLFALDSAEVAERIPAGTRIDKPTYFADQKKDGK